MRTAMMLSGLLAGLMLLPSGLALHCNGEITTIETGVTVFYIDDRSGGAGEVDRWLYMESNGVHGLQSGGDEVCLQDDEKCSFVNSLFLDWCHHHSHDTKLL